MTPRILTGIAFALWLASIIGPSWRTHDPVSWLGCALTMTPFWYIIWRAVMRRISRAPAPVAPAAAVDANEQVEVEYEPAPTLGR